MYPANISSYRILRLCQKIQQQHNMPPKKLHPISGRELSRKIDRAIYSRNKLNSDSIKKIF